MVIRLQFGKGQQVTQQPGKNRNLACATAALLGPAALGAYVLAIWSLTAGLEILEPFPLAGLLSHWEVWLTLGGAIQMVAGIFERYGELGRFEAPSLLASFSLRTARKRAG
jgi:hypothetical protein